MKKQNKLGTYLAVTAGVGCASSAANAAVVFYGSASNTNLKPDPQGLNLLFFPGQRGYPEADIPSSPSSAYLSGSVGIGVSGGVAFTSGNNLAMLFPRSAIRYATDRDMYGGASVGSGNYVSVDFNGDNIFEAVAQFHLTGTGTGYLMSIATLNAIPSGSTGNLSSIGGGALSIAAGKAMVDAANGIDNFAAAVPEPSGLVLLALGATGLAARRQRRKAASGE